MSLRSMENKQLVEGIKNDKDVEIKKPATPKINKSGKYINLRCFVTNLITEWHCI